MVSTYDSRRPAYINHSSEGRLSKASSRSTGTLYTQRTLSRVSGQGSNYTPRGTSLTTDGRGTSLTSDSYNDPNYINRWCEHYGLLPCSASVLKVNGIETTGDLLNLDRYTVSQLPLKDTEKLLFRGALLQFKQNDFQVAHRQKMKGR